MYASQKGKMMRVYDWQKWTSFKKKVMVAFFVTGVGLMGGIEAGTSTSWSAEAVIICLLTSASIALSIRGEDW
jgi:hypothetical protein